MGWRVRGGGRRWVSKLGMLVWRYLGMVSS